MTACPACGFDGAQLERDLTIAEQLKSTPLAVQLADILKRRVAVENALLIHASKGTSPTPDECRELAHRLGIPSQFRREG